MTTVDENVFFREATLRLCSSLDIETALKRCFEYIGLFMPVIRMDLNILDADLNVLQFVASVGVSLPRGSKQVLPLPEKGRNERATFWKNGGMVKIIKGPDPKLGLKEIQEKLGLKPDISAMTMDLNLEVNRIGNLALVADGLNRYTDEHARLLQLLYEPFAVAMSNALEHKEVIRFKELLADDNRYLRDELRSVSGDEIVGSDFGLNAVMKMVQQVAPA